MDDERRETPLRFFRKYVRKYWKMFLTALAFLTVEALADLMQPTIMARIVDVGVANANMDYVLRMGGLMLLVTGVGAIGAAGRNILASRVSQRFGTELRSDLFRTIQSFSFHTIDRFDKASLVIRITNDVTQVQNFANGMMRIFVKAPLLCIGSLIMAVRLNPQLSAVFTVVVPVVAVLIAMNIRIGIPFFTKVQRALDRVNGVIREYLSGVRVVKAFNRFDYEADKFDAANQEYRKRATVAARAIAVFNPGMMLAVNLGIVAVVWFGGIKVSRGSMQVGHVIAFVNYMTQILFAFMTISMVFNMFVRARASAGRIGEVFAAGSAPARTGAGADGAAVNAAGAEPAAVNAAYGSIVAGGGSVEFEDVTFAYEGTSGPPVLKNISFACKPGETVGIIGSTGSGKSTLVSLIPRFYEASSGTVKVGWVDVKRYDPKQLRELIAYVPQRIVLFSGTVADNIRWGKEGATREEIVQAAKLAAAHDFVSSFPEGYDTVLGQGGVNLSGGQKQRLSIARALVRQPQILILDDCTSAVDVATEARIKESLRAYAKRLTCLIIAQRITSVMDADHILVLDQGEIVGAGTHESLLKSCRVYQEIYRSQVGKEVQAHVTVTGTL
jgi:ATP-binding cassette subfamily B multidrug efflux pump